ncbi:putative L-ribulose-5-phosphate 4-epimerase [Aedoeadaptatus coxii]|uniref:Putative L-ribulose-5-phosphate 4-epimerase n=1 Tax=Aedoeadaptatus coxii TaxID=755172 RepID=A0A134AD05_9FIRM|nr:class II aldolase/adducin family protein [Peptoniphilus coxii]KXB65602.1 putative L-ribulose-5-phosphate 4-epimerase [Peptoniphilus coxii]
MDIQKRQKLIQYGKKMVENNLTFSTGGNLSIRIDDRSFLITPSGMAYESLKERDLVVMTSEGEILKGDRKPSSEWHMHGAIYNARPEIKVLIHTHSPYVSVVSSLGEELPPISYLIASAGTRIVPFARYETFGTKELGEAAVEAMGDCKAVMLANHGLIAGGDTLAQAFSLAQEIEFCAFMYVTALSTGKKINFIPDDKMDEVIEKFKGYGQ